MSSFFSWEETRKSLTAQLGTDQFYSNLKKPVDFSLTTPILILLTVLGLLIALLIAYSLLSGKKTRVKKIRMNSSRMKFFDSENRRYLNKSSSLDEQVSFYTSNPELIRVLKELITVSGFEPASVMEDSDVFENAVKKYLDKPVQNPEIVSMISRTRLHLGFTFENPGIRFFSTKQIPKGTKVRASFPALKKKMSYITKLVGTDENNFAIYPPKSKGIPLHVKGQTRMSFQLFGANGEEFRFESEISKQMKEEERWIFLSHAEDVSVMRKRRFKRYPVSIPIQLYSADDIEKNSANPCLIRDFGRGGLRVWLERDDVDLNENMMVFFAVEEAEIDQIFALPTKFEKSFRGLEASLKFVKVSSVNRMLIDRFVDEKLERGEEIA